MKSKILFLPKNGNLRRYCQKNWVTMQKNKTKYGRYCGIHKLREGGKILIGKKLERKTDNLPTEELEKKSAIKIQSWIQRKSH